MPSIHIFYILHELSPSSGGDGGAVRQERGGIAGERGEGLALV